MTKEERTQRLARIMTENQLSAGDVGRILSRSPQTVRSWRCKYDQRTIPHNQLRLLELELVGRARP